MGFTNSNYDDNHFNHSLIGCFDDINQGSFSGNNIPECIRQKGFDYNYDYNALNNKPTINGCILAGDISFDDLGLPEVVAACTQAYAEGCIFPYVDCCMDAMCECLCCAARDITENVECLHSATVACINETKTCLACDIDTVNTNLTLCINCVSCDLTSCINTVCTDLEDSMGAAFTCLSDDIADINSLIPTQASDINQLADKAFVNSTVGTNTSNYIKYNGGPFPSVECLEAYSGCLTNNDYAFVCGIDSCGNAYYDRYKYTIEEITTEEYTADQGSWGCEYRLNNSSFTATQFAAIDSGISANVLPSDMSSSNKLVSENALDDKLDNKTDPENAGKVVGVNEDGDLTFVDSVSGRVTQMTQDAYDALPSATKHDSQFREITDAEETEGPVNILYDLLPIGTILMNGAAVTPDGFLPCDGRAVSRTVYKALFDVIGVTWGAGDGGTTFNVPDFRDRHPQGANGNLGDYIEAGLPNIKAEWDRKGANNGEDFNLMNNYDVVSGAFVKKNMGRTTKATAGSSGNYQGGDLGFDASQSNPIYSDDCDTVQPPSNATNFIIKAFKTYEHVGQSEGSIIPDITQAEYESLPIEIQNNGQIRHITDAPETPVPFAVVNDSKTTAANVWTAQKINSEIESAIETHENKHNYSTEETVIGKWIDGKPIYRKVFDLQGTSGTQEIDLTSLSVEYLINASAIGSDGSNYATTNKWVIGSVATSSAREIYLQTNNKLRVATTTFLSFAIIEYTKTTD